MNHYDARFVIITCGCFLRIIISLINVVLTIRSYRNKEVEPKKKSYLSQINFIG